MGRIGMSTERAEIDVTQGTIRLGTFRVVRKAAA